MDNCISMLLQNRWIIKAENPEQYYKVKDNIKELRQLFSDKFGYSLFVHQLFIRLDKIPGKSEPWMGIQDFQSINEYILFCYILVYLEDKEIEEQFILSNLTEFIQLKMGVGDEYWLIFTNRKNFVSVLKFCIREKIIVQDDGDSERFAQNQFVEALFENTGLSRYFMRNFVIDVFEWKKPKDVMSNEWINATNQNRGLVRKHRIYRRLLLSCGIYLENEDDDDFSYIRKQRKTMEKDFNMLFPCDLQVYKSSAYLALEENVRVGQFFPREQAIDEMVLVVFQAFQNRIKSKSFYVNNHDIVIEKKEHIENILKSIIKKNIQYLPSTYRQQSIDQLMNRIYARMLEIGFAYEENQVVYLYPSISKLSGGYEKGEEE